MLSEKSSGLIIFYLCTRKQRKRKRPGILILLDKSLT